jgi:RHS repeat-associated protein
VILLIIEKLASQKSIPKKAWYQAQNVTSTPPQNASKVQEYNYTPDMLNRSSVINNGVFEGYTANWMNQYTGVGGLSPAYNDGNFNLTGFNGATYVYGYTSQLISASKGGNSVQFTYDGLGRCVRRVVNGAARIFTYDGWKPMLEWDGAGNWLAMNFYGAGPDEILARYDSIGRALTYKRDKQGNVVALLGNDGSVVEKYRYDAFGQPTVTDYWGNVWAGSIHENRFMFTGREWIKELGIYDYRNRFYHPGLGRFLQSDPLGLQTEGVKLTAGEKALFSPGGTAPEVFSSSEMNLFRYCGDDPVDGSDPMGLLEYKFERGFPVNTPGGRKAIERAIEKQLRNTKDGQRLLKAPGTVIIRQVSADHPTTGTSFDPRPGSSPNFTTYLDASDSRFQDRTTFRQLYKHPGELPPDNDKGRAAIIGHEFEHGVDKILNEMETIKKGENPVRDQLDIPLRRSSNGEQIPYPYK